MAAFFNFTFSLTTIVHQHLLGLRHDRRYQLSGHGNSQLPLCFLTTIYIYYIKQQIYPTFPSTRKRSFQKLNKFLTETKSCKNMTQQIQLPTKFLSVHSLALLRIRIYNLQLYDGHNWLLAQSALKTLISVMSLLMTKHDNDK